jgi:hypothetical protein
VKLPEGRPFAVALTTMVAFALIGLGPAVLIPRKPIQATTTSGSGAQPVARQPAP